MRKSGILLVSLFGFAGLARAEKPIVKVPDPKFRIYVAIADDAEAKSQKVLKWKLGEIRKELSKDKGWRYQWWLQLVERREDAEVALELTDYERKIPGHGYQDNIFLGANMTSLPSGRSSRVMARSLEKDTAEVEKRLLIAVCDALEPGAATDGRLKPRSR
jgi:hypothetical protein